MKKQSSFQKDLEQVSCYIKYTGIGFAGQESTNNIVIITMKRIKVLEHLLYERRQKEPRLLREAIPPLCINIEWEGVKRTTSDFSALSDEEKTNWKTRNFI